MSENLFCSGQKVLRNTDAWYRTFKGHPKISKNVREMIGEWIDEERYNRAMIFFMGRCEFDEDYSEFLVREMISGNL